MEKSVNNRAKWADSQKIEWINIILKFLASWIGVFLGNLFLFFFFSAFLTRGLKEVLEKETSKLNFSGGEIISPAQTDQNKEEWLEKHVPQESIKEQLKLWINLYKYLPSYQNSDKLEINRHALFYGPPGTGKTYLAKIFGENESLAYGFVSLGSELYKGSSKKKIENIFQQAQTKLTAEETKIGRGKTKPIVIIIDEIDSIGIKTFSQFDSSNEAINELLTMIDKINSQELNIIVIGITNYFDKLEEALVRSGRLGNHIEFSYPTESEIRKMVVYLREMIEATEESGYKSDRIMLSENFWSEVTETTLQISREGLSISLIDMEKAFKLALAKQVNRDVATITPDIEDYEQQLRKTSETNRKNVNQNAGAFTETQITDFLSSFFSQTQSSS